MADVTKPLAASSEMVNGGNLAVIHKQCGMIKHLNNASQDKILGTLWAEKGPEVPVIWEGNTFWIEVDMQAEGNTGLFTVHDSEREGADACRSHVESSSCGVGKKTWEAF